MTKTHWKKLTNPDYLGAYSLDDPNKTIILTIKSVSHALVTGPDGKKEDRPILHFAEPGVKPMVCNKTNANAITKVAGSPYVEDWPGAQIEIGIEHNVKSFGALVDALRVKPYKPVIKATPKCGECGSELTAPQGKTVDWLARYTQQKYGRVLCAKCAEKEAKKAEVKTDGTDNA